MIARPTAAALSASTVNRRQAAEVGAELAGRRDAAALAAKAARQIPHAAAPPAIVNHYHGPSFHIYGDSGQQAAARLIRQPLTPEPPPGSDTYLEEDRWPSSSSS